MNRLGALLVPFVLSFVSLLLVGCSHPATTADCTKIVEKSVELTLSKMNRSPEEVEKQKSEALAQLSDRIHECVGKKITNGMLRCVDKSESMDDVSNCLK